MTPVSTLNKILLLLKPEDRRPILMWFKENADEHAKKDKEIKRLKDKLKKSIGLLSKG